MCCEHMLEICFVKVCCWQTIVWMDFDAKGGPAVLCGRFSDKQDNKLCIECMSLHQVLLTRCHLQAAGKMWILELRTESCQTMWQYLAQ